MKRGFYGLFFVIGILMAVVIPVHTAEAADGEMVEVPLSGIVDYDESYAALEKINEVREAAGKSRLVMDEVLLEAAVTRAQEVLLYYDHTRPNGESCFSGFQVSGASRAENIAISMSGAAEMVKAWTASSNHSTNILNDSYKSTGIGCFYQPDGKKAWVQIFSDAEATEVTKSGKENVSVTIEALLDNISVELYGNETMDIGNTSALEFQLYNLGGGSVRNLIEPSKITFTSSVEEVASVDASGVVKAHSSGVTTLQAYVTDYPQMEARITVEVKEKPQLMVSPGAVTLVYNGMEQTCEVQVTDPDTLKLLEEGKDYSLTFSNNINAGTMEIRANGMGSYSEQYGLATATIAPRSLKTCTLSYELTENMEDAVISLYDPVLNRSLTFGMDYNYTVTKTETLVMIEIRGGKNYTGYLQDIKYLDEEEPDTPVVDPEPETGKKPEKVKVTGAVSGKKWIVFRWKKGKDVTGYQIQISTSKKFLKNCQTVKLPSTKKKVKFNSLKKNTKYYIRIRAYKKDGGTTLYGKWSVVSKMKTKG